MGLKHNRFYLLKKRQINIMKGSEDIIGAFRTVTEANRKMLSSINTEAMQRVNNMISGAINRSTLCGLAFDVNEYLNLKEKVSGVFSNTYLNSIDTSIFPQRMINDIADMQASVAVIGNITDMTSMLRGLEFNLATADIDGCVNVVQGALNKNTLKIQDFAFLKNSKIVEVFKDMGNVLSLPQGFISDINSINKSAVIKVMNNDNNISFRIDSHKFVDNSSGNTITIGEMNSICAAGDVLEGISADEKLSETELMDFMAFLDSSPMMAMYNDVGKKIFNIINNFNKTISFDKKCYYHCRARSNSEPPFVWEQMKAAPYGFTFPGRYNHAGQSYFYFADTKDGAEKEIGKHMSEKDRKIKTLQTVELGVRGEVNLIDLSAKSMRGLNTFLRYIRFPLENDKSSRPRVYLIPSFVSECCRQCNIDGIKYYGGKDYSNYVTWSDGYYNFIRNV